MIKKGKTPSLGTPGAVSLLVTFAVLSVAIFAILILSTCLSDTKRADRTYAITDSYYAADCEAEEKIAQLRKDGHTGLQEFSVPAGDSMELQVSVDIGKNSVKVNTWKLVSQSEWMAEDTIELLG